MSVYPELTEDESALLVRIYRTNWQVDDLDRDHPTALELERKRLIGWKPSESGGTIWRLNAYGLATARKIIDAS